MAEWRIAFRTLDKCALRNVCGSMGEEQDVASVSLFGRQIEAPPPQMR